MSKLINKLIKDYNYYYVDLFIKNKLKIKNK